MSDDTDTNAKFRRLRALDRELKAQGVTDKHQRAHMLINACIDEDFDTGPRILGALVKLGFDSRHAGIVLRNGLQSDPEWPNWGKAEDGSYYAPLSSLPKI